MSMEYNRLENVLMTSLLQLHSQWAKITQKLSDFNSNFQICIQFSLKKSLNNGAKIIMRSFLGFRNHFQS